MLNTLLEMYSTDMTRAIVITACMVVTFCLLSWVSWIDIKKKSITFWKMLVASSSVIICPFIAAFFCDCRLLKWMFLSAFVIWAALLFFNIKLNKDKFIGKADIDLLTAMLSVLISHSAWLLITTDETTIAWMLITQSFIIVFGWLTIGSVTYMAGFLLYIIFRIATKKSTFKEIIKTKVSVIPMIMPAALVMTYYLMIQ